MKTLRFLVGWVGVLSVPALQAAMQVTLVDNTSMYSYGNGGEFRAVGSADLNSKVNWSAYSAKTSGTTSDTVDGGSWGYKSGLAVAGQKYFQTFCIEYNEDFYPGRIYDVAISDKAMYGGQPSSGDPISIGTAWLYMEFAKGTLSGYDYNYNGNKDGVAGGNRTASAGLLQQAIWWLEQEPNGKRNTFIDAAEEALYGTGKKGNGWDTLIKGDANGAYGVKALNLGAAGAVQDQLVIVPEPTTLIAGALLLLPFGTSVLRILRRNRAA